jgi:hypothetical protein
MYVLNDLAKMTHLRGRAYAAHRAGNRGNPARPLAILHLLRGRRAARAY